MNHGFRVGSSRVLPGVKAIEISRFGGPEVLKLVERPRPEPGPAEIVVQVEAAGVARADLLQREGKYPPPAGASDIPGLDIAGEVASVGAEVRNFATGDKVCAILNGGGYAEYCAIPEGQALLTPKNWSTLEAATLPENLFTVYDNVVTRAGLCKNESLLIHGGASGIGTMAVMLGRLFGATVLVTAGSDEKCGKCLELGAHHAINYHDSDFVLEVRARTNGQGVDVVLDMVGGAYLDRNVAALAKEGRVAIIATQGGTVSQLNLAPLLQKRIRILGSTMRARNPLEKSKVAQALWQNVWPSLPAKAPIFPVIDSTYRLADAAKAHARLESGAAMGKVVLICS